MSTLETEPTLTALAVLHEGQDWPLWMDDDTEAYIRDIEWAERLRYERPRAIRDLIKRMIDEGTLGRVVCRTVRQTAGSVGGRPSVEYYLTLGQALKVAARSETRNADRMLDVLIAVFLKVSSGKFSLPATAPDPAAPPAWAEQMMGAMGQMAATVSTAVEQMAKLAQQVAQRPAEVVVPRIVQSAPPHRRIAPPQPRAETRIVSTAKPEATVGTGMGLQLPRVVVLRLLRESHEGLALLCRVLWFARESGECFASQPTLRVTGHVMTLVVLRRALHYLVAAGDLTEHRNVGRGTITYRPGGHVLTMEPDRVIIPGWAWKRYKPSLLAVYIALCLSGTDDHAVLQELMGGALSRSRLYAILAELRGEAGSSAPAP